MITTILVGLFAALAFTEITGVLPGGLIVPAYFALYADQPGRMAATLAAGLIALGLYKLAARYVLLFGRRRFVFFLLIGALVGQAGFLIWPNLAVAGFDLRVIGWIIPGLLANNLARQKFVPTIAALAASVVLTVVLVKLIAMI